MGNCLFGGEANDQMVIKVVTAGNGGIMEFCAPITVEFITDEFPGHGIFRSPRPDDLFCPRTNPPLPNHEVLQAGEYYLLPLLQEDDKMIKKRADHAGSSIDNMGSLDHDVIRSNSVPQLIQSSARGPRAVVPQQLPYRMSFDGQLSLLKRSHTTQLFSRNHHHNHDQQLNYMNGGFWKVKLVISPQHLLHILSQEAPTQELIDSVRTVAKCSSRNHHPHHIIQYGFSSSASSDHEYSLSSSSRSRNASKKGDAFLLDF